MSRPAWLLGQRTKKLESVLRGGNHALDNCRDFARAVAIGTNHFLYHRWVHSHPVGFGDRCPCNSARSRPKSYLMGDINMKPISWVAIVLIVLGALALAYQGIDYTRQKKVLDVGSVHLTEETHEQIPIPPILGGLALVGGVVLLVVGARNQS